MPFYNPKTKIPKGLITGLILTAPPTAPNKGT
jgi:hypothetical protein